MLTELEAKLLVKGDGSGWIGNADAGVEEFDHFEPTRSMERARLQRKFSFGDIQFVFWAGGVEVCFLKSFSWTLALRYLNPLRAFVSVITLLSLLGVAFGVMVLIVVLSVHSGFERTLKEIMLGFAPHVRVESAYNEGILDWAEMEEHFKEDDEVIGAYSLVEGYVLLDAEGWRRPASFRGINTESEAQIESLTELLDLEAYPESQADMGLDEFAVISRQLAESLQLKVGDSIRLIASSNLEAVLDVYNVAQQDAAWKYYNKQTEPFEEMVGRMFTVENGERVSVEDVNRAMNYLKPLIPGAGGEGESMRQEERQLFDEIVYGILEAPTMKQDDFWVYQKGTQDQLKAQIKALKEMNLEEADNAAFKGIEEFVLPKELTVYGVYADTKRAQGPHAFVPLHIAQELKGLEGVAEAIGLKIEDPFDAEKAAQELRQKLGPEWRVRSWMSTHAQQFELMQTEKVMMSFALSFITVLSAFSIMAVMYTVTLQKRQEIGVMKALGARPIQIVNVFVYQGIIVGIFGSLLGLGLGLLAIHFREGIVDAMRAIGIDPFPPEFHGMNVIPAHIVPEYLALICVVAVILCLIAALIPALFAAFRDPAKSLRNL